MTIAFFHLDADMARKRHDRRIAHLVLRDSGNERESEIVKSAQNAGFVRKSARQDSFLGRLRRASGSREFSEAALPNFKGLTLQFDKLALYRNKHPDL